jgi:hypothetical protein
MCRLLILALNLKLALYFYQALDLGRGANPNGYMVEEIWEELAKAKYLEWEEESTQRSWELQSLKYVIPVSLGCTIIADLCSYVLREL